jgi:hypothetical protein
MFKFLNVFLNEFDLLNETINAYINRKKTMNLPFFYEWKSFLFLAIDKKLKELVDFESIHRIIKIISLNY